MLNTIILLYYLYYNSTQFVVSPLYTGSIIRICECQLNEVIRESKGLWNLLLNSGREDKGDSGKKKRFEGGTASEVFAEQPQMHENANSRRCRNTPVFIRTFVCPTSPSLIDTPLCSFSAHWSLNSARMTMSGVGSSFSFLILLALTSRVQNKIQKSSRLQKSWNNCVVCEF